MKSGTPSSFPNRFGRRPGRGIRPWLLLPKLLAVALYFGGLGAMAVLWFSSGFRTLAAIDPRRLLILQHIGHLAIYLVVPSLLAALAFGIALLLQHPRQFIRMRWLLIKLAIIAAFVPTAHFFVSSRVAILRIDFANRASGDPAARQLAFGLIAAVFVSACIIILGRLKPRLGQNWARTFLPDLPGPQKQTDEHG
jgi:hypothetical protein